MHLELPPLRVNVRLHGIPLLSMTEQGRFIGETRPRRVPPAPCLSGELHRTTASPKLEQGNGQLEDSEQLCGLLSPLAHPRAIAPAGSTPKASISLSVPSSIISIGSSRGASPHGGARATAAGLKEKPRNVMGNARLTLLNGGALAPRPTGFVPLAIALGLAPENCVATTHAPPDPESELSVSEVSTRAPTPAPWPAGVSGEGSDGMMDVEEDDTEIAELTYGAGCTRPPSRRSAALFNAGDSSACTPVHAEPPTRRPPAAAPNNGCAAPTLEVATASLQNEDDVDETTVVDMALWAAHRKGVVAVSEQALKEAMPSWLPRGTRLLGQQIFTPVH